MSTQHNHQTHQSAREFLESALAESAADESDPSGGSGWDVEVDARTVLGLLDNGPELDFTAQQHSTILSALFDKKFETERYASSYSDAAKEPTASDLCCAYHEARFSERQYSHQVLQEKVVEIQNLIGIFEKLSKAAEIKEAGVCLTDPTATRDADGFCTAHGNDCTEFALHLRS